MDLTDYKTQNEEITHWKARALAAEKELADIKDKLRNPWLTVGGAFGFASSSQPPNRAPEADAAPRIDADRLQGE